MKDPSSKQQEQQFLILAPTGRDAALTGQLLTNARMQVTLCRDMSEVCERFAQQGAMGLLVAEEALSERALSTLSELLAVQPAWSDLPILLFTGGRSAHSRAFSARSIEALGNVTLLERPLRPVTMLSAANAALRARKRQYMARDELKAQREQVRQRDQFLAMLGHELRNPLSAITMAVELDGEGAAAQYKAIVSRQARHLTRLVDDLLDVARVTTGKIVLQRAPIDVADLVRRALLGTQAAMAQHQLALKVEIAEQPLVVEADSVRLEQILVNLINNAIKYTPARGQIEVRVQALDDEAQIRVRDNGVGIAPDMLPRVFDLFAQAEGTLDRAKGGMGIGLTLVRSLVQLHGGRIMAESEGLGRGSTFIVHLPRSHEKSQPSHRAPTARVKGAQRQVLIIEDNDDSRELMASMLRRRKHEVETAADGPSGVEWALKRSFSAILIDIGLPGLDGYAVARALRARLGRDVLMIAVTGYGQPEDKQRALDAGFDAHLTKPVELGRLDQLLARESAPSHATK